MALGAARARGAEAVAEVVEEDGLVADHHLEAVPHIQVETITIITMDPLEAETPRVSSGARQITTVDLL